jgi:hypothetical protein
VRRPSNSRRAALLAMTLACAAGRAAAQVPSSETDRPHVKLGAFELWPTLVLRNVGVDENVFNEPENPKRDFTATFAPTLDVVVRPPRTQLTVTTTGEFVYFGEYEDERHVNRIFNARGEFDLTWFHPSAAFGANDSEERPTPEIDTRARSTLRTYGAGVRIPIGPIVSANAGARRQTLRYDESESFRGVPLAHELNSELRAFDASVNVAVTPITSVGVTFTREEERFDGSPLRSSDSVRVMPTVTFRPLGLFSGSASVGWRRFDAIDPGLEDYSGLAAAGTIGVVLAERYHVETAFSRDIRYSYDELTPTYLWTAVRGTFRMDLFAGVDLKVTGARDVMGYRALAGGEPAGRDVVISYGGGVGYTIGEWLRVGVDADFTDRTSGDAGREYTNNRVFGTLVWGVRPQ